MSEEETKQVSASEKALAADPASLGLFAFAFTTALLSSINAGFLPLSAISAVIPLALFWGGVSQMIAGGFEMRRGNTFGFTAFTSYGAFWIFLAVFVMMGGDITSPGWKAALLFWGIFSFLMWIPAMMANLTLNLTFLCLWLALICLAFGFDMLGGYFGLGAGFFAAWTGFAVVVNSVRPNTIPVGPGILKKRK
ncbi:MAG TPA: acetate uptake transporter [Candidatus Lokiarchaeia archaeon]|nr:acetate uptake transporter [Candidatus Lokiarchaeia archaeon]